MCIGWTKKRNTVYNNIFLNSKGKKRKETSIVSTGIFFTSRNQINGHVLVIYNDESSAPFEDENNLLVEEHTSPKKNG